MSLDAVGLYRGCGATSWNSLCAGEASCDGFVFVPDGAAAVPPVVPLPVLPPPAGGSGGVPMGGGDPLLFGGVDVSVVVPVVGSVDAGVLLGDVDGSTIGGSVAGAVTGTVTVVSGGTVVTSGSVSGGGFGAVVVVSTGTVVVVSVGGSTTAVSPRAGAVIASTGAHAKSATANPRTRH